MGPLQVVDDGKFKLVSRDVRTSLGERYVVETGACSTEETKKSHARAYHDACAVATTRAMKRGLEAVIGLPFINTMIKELFGGYQVGIDPELRDVTPARSRELTREQAEKLPPRVRESARSIYVKLRGALAEFLITQEEHDARWDRALLTLDNFQGLHQEEANLDELLAERREAADKNRGRR